MPTPKDLDLPDEWNCDTCGKRVPMLETMIDPLTLNINCAACDEKIARLQIE